MVPLERQGCPQAWHCSRIAVLARFNSKRDPQRYTTVQVLAISRYDGRGTISLQDSVKSQHILPFFPNFVAWARRLETLLVGTDAEAEITAGTLTCRSSSRCWTAVSWTIHSSSLCMRSGGYDAPRCLRI